jgi:hypothetical protein
MVGVCYWHKAVFAVNDCPALCLRVPVCPGVMQDVLVKELPLEYNKEDLLNPCFVVFGKRRQ